MSCVIHLDNFQSQYYAGSLIEGRVVCSFTSSENVRGIRLRLAGREHNEWRKTERHYDHHRKKSRTERVRYHGDHQFFAVEIMLVGEGELVAGRHEYSFSLNLPKKIPGTYHGKYGWVKFFVKATVDRPYKFDYEDEKELNVVAPVDFNEMKDELQLKPVVYSDDKTLCCCCCARGIITMNVHLEKEAFIRGETANVRVSITNMANENVESVRVELSMTVTSKVTSPRHDTKHDQELLAASSDTGVGAHAERTYDFKLEIPQSAVVPNFDLCTLFSKWCILKVSALLPTCHTNMTVSTGIVMGHIPIGAQAQFPNMTLQQNFNVVPPYAPPQTKQAPMGDVPGNDPPPYCFVSPSEISPMLPPPSGSAARFPSLPPGAILPGPPPNVTPRPSGAGPSAPPMDDAASAPSKTELEKAEEEEFVVVGGNSNVSEFAPPSYNEAVLPNKNWP